MYKKDVCWTFSYQKKKKITHNISEKKGKNAKAKRKNNQKKQKLEFNISHFTLFD